MQYENIDLTSRRKIHAQKLRIIRSETGMNRKAFSAWLDIPYRTYQDWERAATLAPSYVVQLIGYKVKSEKEKGYRFVAAKNHIII